MADNSAQGSGSNGSETGIPDTIELGGQIYHVRSTPALMDLIKVAGAKERAKLYSTIEELKTGLRELKNVEIIPDGGGRQNGNQGINSSDLAAIVEGAIDRKLAPVLASMNKRDSEDLESYRQRRIRENADKCIPEYVTGNTKEEIDQNLDKTIQIRASLPSPFAPQRPNGSAPVIDPIIQAQMNNANNTPGAVSPAYQIPAKANSTDPAAVGVRDGLPAGTPSSAASPSTTPAASATTNAAPQSSPAGTRSLPQFESPKLDGLIPDTKNMTQKEYALKRDELFRNLENALQA